MENKKIPYDLSLNQSLNKKEARDRAIHKSRKYIVHQDPILKLGFESP